MGVVWAVVLSELVEHWQNIYLLSTVLKDEYKEKRSRERHIFKKAGRCRSNEICSFTA